MNDFLRQFFLLKKTKRSFITQDMLLNTSNLNVVHYVQHIIKNIFVAKTWG